jgi:hypothetical protein
VRHGNRLVVIRCREEILEERQYKSRPRDSRSSRPSAISAIRRIKLAAC